jgi:hypothetical protein
MGHREVFDAETKEFSPANEVALPEEWPTVDTKIGDGGGVLSPSMELAGTGAPWGGAGKRWNDCLRFVSSGSSIGDYAIEA